MKCIPFSPTTSAPGPPIMSPLYYHCPFLALNEWIPWIDESEQMNILSSFSQPYFLFWKVAWDLMKQKWFALNTLDQTFIWLSSRSWRIRIELVLNDMSLYPCDVQIKLCYCFPNFEVSSVLFKWERGTIKSTTPIKKTWKDSLNFNI